MPLLSPLTLLIALLAGDALGAALGQARSPAPPTPADARSASGPDGAPFDAFPAYLWRMEHLGRPLPAATVAGVGGTEVARAESAAWALALGVRFYVRHGAGRDALHLDREAGTYPTTLAAWRASRGAADLVRRPCLSDPATRADLHARLERSLAPADRAHADFVALGDEIGTTPFGDPLDLCRSPHCDAAWQRWLAEHGARHGLAPGARRPLTDAVLDVREGPELGAWLAARAFQRRVVADRLTELAARAAELRPDLPVAVLGLIGETAFGGVDLERLAPAIQVVEPYPVADALPRLATLRALDGAPRRVLATLFLERFDGPAELTAELERLGRGPVDGVVVWCDRDLAAAPARRAALVAGLERLRAARARAPRLDRDPHGIAWLASDDALAHAWLEDARGDGREWWRRLAGYQEREGTLERRRRAWFERWQAAGARPGALDVGRVDADLVTRFPRLFACRLTVVSDAELERLERYVAAGGRVGIEGPFAVLRPDGTRRAHEDLPVWARR